MFASAGFGGGCSAGACQQIIKIMKKKFNQSRRMPGELFQH
jgi:hypothetical protein